MLEYTLGSASLAAAADKPLLALALVALSGAMYTLKRTVTQKGPTQHVGEDIGGTRVAVMDSQGPTAFVFCHGLGGSIGKAAQMQLAHALHAFGPVVFFERRGFGNIPHIDPSPSTCEDDARTALLVAHSLRERVIIVGFSLGSNTALRISVHHNLECILIGAFCDARALTTTSAIELALCHCTQLTNVHIARKMRARRALVLHSEHDTFIPPWHAHALTDILTNAGCEASLVLVQGSHSAPLVQKHILKKFIDGANSLPRH